MKIVALILMYIFVYSNINFIKILNISLPVYLSIGGLSVFYIKLILTKKLKINRSYIYIFLVSFLLMIYYIYRCLLEKKIEISPFNYYFFRQIRFLLAAYFIYIFYVKVYREKYYEKAIRDFITVVLVDNLIAFIRYINPWINNVLFLIQNKNNDLNILEELTKSKVRFIGFGEFFFGAGIINSIALILIVYLFSLNKKNKCYLMFNYLFIFFIGTLSSRTTLIGVVIGIFYYSSNNSKNFKTFLKKFLKFFSVFLILIYVLISLLKELSNTFENIYNKFVIEYGYRSLEHLNEMWKVIPKRMTTLFWGDLKWNEYQNDILIGYYKNTDVGYLRIIWSIGLIGLVLFLIFQILLYRKIKLKLSRQESLLISSLFFLQIILNVKGYTDVLPVIYFLLIVYEAKKINFKNNYINGDGK